MHDTVAFTYHNWATGNLFDSPDGVMHRATKERNRGDENPMIRPFQNNRERCRTSPVNKLYAHTFSVWRLANSLQADLIVVFTLCFPPGSAHLKGNSFWRKA